jgi:CRP-like cAMP-binding protein
VHRRSAWDTVERAALLGEAPLGRGLAPETARALAERLRPRRVQKGDYVFLAGEPADTFSLLAAGRVKVIGGAGGRRETVLRLIGPGDVFGGAGVWGEAHYPASAVALDEAVVLQMLARELVVLLGRHPDLALALLREIGRRLREAETRIRDLQTAPAEGRIARALLRLAAEAGDGAGGGRAGVVPLPAPLSRRDLAALAGTTLSTASRTLSAWHRLGIVAAGRERVAVRLPRALAALADQGGDRPAPAAVAGAGRSLRQRKERPRPGGYTNGADPD